MADVSRETPVEPEPSAAIALFGDRIGIAREYAAQLVESGELLGLIGPAELPRLWSRHILNCALLAPLVRPGRVGDIGSGAGLPGLVLAIARPDAEFVLIEPMERRAEWLRTEAARLGLENVRVERARAEELRPAPPLDQVTARAVAALGKLVPLARPLLRAGGEMLFMKGSRLEDEIRAAEKQLRRAGIPSWEVLILGQGVLPEETRVFRATVD